MRVQKSGESGCCSSAVKCISLYDIVVISARNESGENRQQTHSRATLYLPLAAIPPTMTQAKTYDCPSPDCSFTTGGIAELLEHVNGHHPGEYQREDWPDTEAGRATREADRDDEDDEE